MFTDDAQGSSRKEAVTEGSVEGEPGWHPRKRLHVGAAGWELLFAVEALVVLRPAGLSASSVMSALSEQPRLWTLGRPCAESPSRVSSRKWKDESWQSVGRVPRAPEGKEGAVSAPSANASGRHSGAPFPWHARSCAFLRFAVVVEPIYSFTVLKALKRVSRILFLFGDKLQRLFHLPSEFIWYRFSTSDRP